MAHICIKLYLLLYQNKIIYIYIYYKLTQRNIYSKSVEVSIDMSTKHHSRQATLIEDINSTNIYLFPLSSSKESQAKGYNILWE